MIRGSPKCLRALDVTPHSKAALLYLVESVRNGIKLHGSYTGGTHKLFRKTKMELREGIVVGIAVQNGILNHS